MKCRHCVGAPPQTPRLRRAFFNGKGTEGVCGCAAHGAFGPDCYGSRGPKALPPAAGPLPQARGLGRSPKAVTGDDIETYA